MFKFLSKKITKNYKQVPLMYVLFDLAKYQEMGAKGSCDLVLHPSLKNDEFLIKHVNQLVDHIRDNYDMEELSK